MSHILLWYYKTFINTQQLTHYWSTFHAKKKKGNETRPATKSSERKRCSQWPLKCCNSDSETILRYHVWLLIPKELVYSAEERYCLHQRFEPRLETREKANENASKNTTEWKHMGRNLCVSSCLLCKIKIEPKMFRSDRPHVCECVSACGDDL